LNVRSYVIALKTGKFDEAIDSLHKFYDNATLASLSPTISIVPAINSMNNTKSEKQLLPGDLFLLPHALYDEALTHFRYGHFENALQFVNEMIRLSQERNDDRALVKALTLLHRLILIISKGNITILFNVSNFHSRSHPHFFLAQNFSCTKVI
jgi:tetratricopeptide (TPR) repeat protein